MASKLFVVVLTQAEVDAALEALTFVEAGGGIDGEPARRVQARDRVVKKLRGEAKSG